MNTPVLSILCSVLFCILSLPASTSRAADTLKDKLRESGWDGIIGTWVDADTKGTNAKISYAWKIEDRVIEENSEMGGKRSVALMGGAAAAGTGACPVGGNRTRYTTRPRMATTAIPMKPKNRCIGLMPPSLVSAPN